MAMITRVKTVTFDGSTIGDGVTWLRVNCSVCGEQAKDVVLASIHGNRLVMDRTGATTCTNEECESYRKIIPWSTK